MGLTGNVMMELDQMDKERGGKGVQEVLHRMAMRHNIMHLVEYVKTPSKCKRVRNRLARCLGCCRLRRWISRYLNPRCFSSGKLEWRLHSRLIHIELLFSQANQLLGFAQGKASWDRIRIVAGVPLLSTEGSRLK